MISLKKHLDELAGPNHPFVKGALGREVSKNENDKDTKAVEEELIKTLNQFLRTNRN